ncbi:MAG: H-X9-DG-CTERM domain-containing protein, partial [Candidatus Saccharimonadales bacterium]
FRFAPIDWSNTWGFRSRHPGGLNFAIADGSVRWIGEGVDLKVYRALATVHGREAIGGDRW